MTQAGDVGIRPSSASGANGDRGPINDDIATLVVAQLLFLEAENPKKEISMYINSPGGMVTSGLAIYDTHAVRASAGVDDVSRAGGLDGIDCLKCSVPNAGPPVVSISTTRETLSPSGLAQDVAALAKALFAAGGGVAAPVDAAGAVSAAGAEAADAT
jgi:hypothetical protein